MKFDLGRYKTENAELFGNASLDDVAKHIYENTVPANSKDGSTYAASGRFSDYNDFAKKTGLSDQIGAYKKAASAPDNPGVLGGIVDLAASAARVIPLVPSFVLNSAAGGLRTASDWTAAAGDALRDSPNLRAASSFVLGAPGAFTDKIAGEMSRANSKTSMATILANDLEGRGKQMEADVRALLPESKQVLTNEGFRGDISRGVESAGTSVALAYLGGGLASGRNLLGAADLGTATGKAVGLLSSSVGFGLSRYQEAKHEALQNGFNEDDARNYATIQGAWETGSELVSDSVALLTGGAVPITSIGVKNMQNGLGAMFRTSLAQRGVDALKIFAAEAGSELINTYAQTEASNAVGLGVVDPNTGQQMTGFGAVRESFGEVGVASVIFALLGSHMNHKTRLDLQATLTNPNIPAEQKLPIIQQLGEEMNKLDSYVGLREGTAGTEFMASAERQLEQTGNISLTNSLHYDEQIKNEIEDQDFAEAHAAGGDYNPQDDADRIAAEAAPVGTAPLGMKSDADLPVDLPPASKPVEPTPAASAPALVGHSDAPYADFQSEEYHNDFDYHDEPADVNVVRSAHLDEMDGFDPSYGQGDESYANAAASEAFSAEGKSPLPSESLYNDTTNPVGYTHDREDFDTHPGADDLARNYVKSRAGGDISRETVGEAMKSGSREDLSWAAAASKQRESDLWRSYRQAPTPREKSSILKSIDIARNQHTYAMGKLETAAGFNPDAIAKQPLRAIPSKKMHPSKGDDQAKVRSGVVNAFARFLSSHNLTMVKDKKSGNVYLRKNSKSIADRQANHDTASKAYDAGYIYDTHSIVPNANYASGVVGGVPGFDKLHWRGIDSVAYHSPSINFNNTRVGAHALYNSAVTEGSAEAVSQAEKNLTQHYANRRAASRDSRPADIFGDKSWSGPRISAAAASEIESRAKTAIERGTFKGRIREFSDKDGNRILRLIYSNETPDHFEDYLIDGSANVTPEQASRMADKVAAGAKIRSKLPRKIGTPSNAVDVVDDIIEEHAKAGREALKAGDIAGAKAAVARIRAIKADRKQHVKNVAKAMNIEYVHNDAPGDGLTADISDASAVSESKLSDPYAIGEDTAKSGTDANKEAVKTATAQLRSAARVDRTDAGHDARELFNSSDVTKHEDNLDEISDSVAEARKDARYQRKLLSTNLTQDDYIKAQVALVEAEKRAAYSSAMYREYSRMMDEQATREEGESGYKEEVDSNNFHLSQDGTRSQPLPGYITYDDAVGMIESNNKNVRPLYSGGRLVGVAVRDAKGNVHRLPIDHGADPFSMRSLSADPSSSKDRRKAGSKLTKQELATCIERVESILKALNVPSSMRGKLRFVTAKSLYERHGLENGLHGAIGAYMPSTDTSFIIVDNIHSPDELYRSVLHEVGAHGGLFAFVPDKAQRRELLNQLLTNRMVIDNFLADGHSDSKHLKNYGDLSPALAERVGHEAFAAIFTRMTMSPDGHFTLPNGRRVGNVITRILATIRGHINAVGKKLGFNFGMSNSQVYQLMAHVVARHNAIVNMPNHLYGNGQTTRNIANANLIGWSKLREDYVDYAHPIEAIQNAIKRLGGVILANQDAHSAITDSTNTTAALSNRFDKEMVRPLLKLCKQHNVDMKRFDMFLVARHALERNAFHANQLTDASGMTDAQALQIIRDAEADGLVTVTRNQNMGYSYGGLYGTLGTHVQDMAKTRLDILYYGHMITKSQRDALNKTYEYYVPMNEVEDLPSTTPGIGGNVVKVSTEQLGRVTGRDTVSTLGLAQMVHRVNSAITAVETNKVAQHFDRLIAANPNGNIAVRLPVGTKLASQRWHMNRLLSIRYNGVERLLLIQNPVIAGALRGGDPVASNRVLNALRKFSSFCVKMNVVYNPPFMITNMGKDAAHAMLTLASRDSIGGVKGSNVVKKMVSLYPQAMRFAFSRHVVSGSYNPDIFINGQQMKMSELYEEFETSGAKPGYVFMGSMANSAREFQKECELVMNRGAGASMKRFMVAGGDFISSLSEASEASTRFASYFAMRSLGLDSVTAGREAKELTINFARRGNKTSVLNALYLFANAGIQGTNMLAKLAYRDGKVNKRFLGVMGSLATFAALVTAACRACGDDDEGVPQYDKLEPYKRSQNLILPGVKGVFPMIPLPYGFGFAYSVGRTLADLSTKEQFGGGKYGTVDAAADIVEAVLQHFNPVGGDTTLDGRGAVHAVTPQAGKLALELFGNANFYGAPIRPEDGGDLPAHLNHKRSTSVPAVAAANAMSKFGFETSPDNLDHITKSLAGGAGKFVTQMIGMMFTGTDTALNDIPVVRRYFGTAPDYVDSRNFKQNVSDVAAARKEYDRIRLDPAMSADVKRFERDYRAEIKASAAIPGYDARLKQLRTARKKAINPAEIAMYNKSIGKVYREFNAYYYSQFKN